MTWNCTRKATGDETAAVAAAAERFCARHGIDRTGGAEFAIRCEIDPAKGADIHTLERARRLRKLWRATLKRLTGSPDGIAYGYVGTSTD